MCALYSPEILQAGAVKLPKTKTEVSHGTVSGTQQPPGIGYSDDRLHLAGPWKTSLTMQTRH